jgi:hypothetical protein
MGPDRGGRAWGMGPRLILSNAQKSAQAHTPSSAADILDSRSQFDSREGQVRSVRSHSGAPPGGL